MAVHHFHPTHYYNTIGSHTPVLYVADGDTIITTTVDAGGWDNAGNQSAVRGNPMTGPFYIEGAEPGDTLVVQLDRIAPNRTYGWSGRMVAPNCVDPEYVPELPWLPKGQRESATWHIDAVANTATLAKPETKLGGLTLPIVPMLGCFGVAPAQGQAISPSP